MQPSHDTASGEQSQTVAKALAVLSAIGQASSPPTVSEIVARTGHGKTAVLRILTTLAAQRMVERDPASSRYRLGTGLIMLAQRALQQHPLLIRTGPFVEELVQVTGDIALVMTLENYRSLCIERRVGHSPIATVGTHIGTRSPLHCGGGPFALLAFSPDDFIADYLSRPLEQPTRRSVTDPAEIRARIREARERGFTIGDEDLFEYVVAVGLPIFGQNGKLIGSVSIGGINHRYPMDRCMQVGAVMKELYNKHIGTP